MAANARVQDMLLDRVSTVDEGNEHSEDSNDYQDHHHRPHKVVHLLSCSSSSSSSSFVLTPTRLVNSIAMMRWILNRWILWMWEPMTEVIPMGACVLFGCVMAASHSLPQQFNGRVDAVARQTLADTPC
jgi:hypothetical protein